MSDLTIAETLNDSEQFLGLTKAMREVQKRGYRLTMRVGPDRPECADPDALPEATVEIQFRLPGMRTALCTTELSGKTDNPLTLIDSLVAKVSANIDVWVSECLNSEGKRSVYMVTCYRCRGEGEVGYKPAGVCPLCDGDGALFRDDPHAFDEKGNPLPEGERWGRCRE